MSITNQNNNCDFNPFFPNEIFQQIFLQADLKTLTKVAQVCKNFRTLTPIHFKTNQTLQAYKEDFITHKVEKKLVSFPIEEWEVVRYFPTPLFEIPTDNFYNLLKTLKENDLTYHQSCESKNLFINKTTNQVLCYDEVTNEYFSNFLKINNVNILDDNYRLYDAFLTENTIYSTLSFERRLVVLKNVLGKESNEIILNLDFSSQYSTLNATYLFKDFLFIIITNNESIIFNLKNHSQILLKDLIKKKSFLPRSFSQNENSLFLYENFENESMLAHLKIDTDNKFYLIDIKTKNTPLQKKGGISFKKLDRSYFPFHVIEHSLPTLFEQTSQFILWDTVEEKEYKLLEIYGFDKIKYHQNGMFLNSNFIPIFKYPSPKIIFFPVKDENSIIYDVSLNHQTFKMITAKRIVSTNSNEQDTIILTQSLITVNVGLYNKYHFKWNTHNKNMFNLKKLVKKIFKPNN